MVEPSNDNDPQSPLSVHRRLPPEVVAVRSLRIELETCMMQIELAVGLGFQTFAELELWHRNEHPRQIAAQWSHVWREKLYGDWLGSRDGFIDP